MTVGPVDLYDRFYDALGKDYAWEARHVLRLATRHRGERPRTLLDVACGTGRHLEHFAAASLTCAGIDLDPAMVAVARRRLPAGVPLQTGDMRTFETGTRFDVVTCLFSSIAYMTTQRGLTAAVRRMAAHLAPGGVVVIEPWYQPEQWVDGELGVLTIDDDDVKATRISRAGRRGRVSSLDFDFLVADAGSTRHHQERHELRLASWSDYERAFDAAGLDMHVDEWGLWGHGLLVGTVTSPRQGATRARERRGSADAP